MYSLQTAHSERVGRNLWTGQRKDTPICYCLTLHEANSSELRQRRKLLDTSVRQAVTARQIYISDAIARFDQLDHSSIGDVRTMAKMDIMKVLTQFADCLDSPVRHEPTFCKDKVPQARSGINYALHRVIFHVLAGSKVQNAKTIKD